MPKFNAIHRDTNEVCQKTLNVSYADWQKMGFSKGTLHWMKKNARENKSFTLYKNARKRLNQWDNPVKATKE